jgi:hypothetical protein
MPRNYKTMGKIALGASKTEHAYTSARIDYSKMTHLPISFYKFPEVFTIPIFKTGNV